MITEFKSKGELVKERIYADAKIFKGIDKERWINIAMGKATGTDRLLISNLFVKTKFQLRETYINLERYWHELKWCNANIERGLTKESLEQHEKYKQALEDAIKSNFNILKAYGQYLIDGLIPLLNAYFTDHEIVQIVGGSIKTAEEIKSTMDRLDLKNKRGFAFNFIYHHGEYRWGRGRAKDFIDCPNWEMPLFNCISDYILYEIENNPKLKQASDEVFEKMFGDAMVYATFDNEGNITATEKVIQNIEFKDLMLNFKDMQVRGIISTLKKENVLSMNEELKLRRLGDDLYQVEDSDGKLLGKVMKK